MVKRVFKIILGLVGLLILMFAFFLGWQTLTEFNPPKEEVISVNNNADSLHDTLSLVTWNIGYFGLGAEMDFFYEGGANVRPSEELYSAYCAAGMQRMASFDSLDFILLQEVDTLSRRSFHDNQYRKIREAMPGFHNFFAPNYVAWVPVPLKNPMGKVHAGVVSLSKNEPVNARRVSFGSSYSWPMRLFQLKRCFLELRFNTKDGRQLVMINTHNSAFEDASELREIELNTLKQLMEAEYRKGNYVVIGGDWNQNPPMFDSSKVLDIYHPQLIKPGIPNDYLPTGWKYAYDPKHTTNRYVNIPYTEGQTSSTLIDFFVVSPNVEVLEITTIPTSFKESDHQPVKMKVRLKAKGSGLKA